MGILTLCFLYQDPLDTSENPTVYVSTNFFFHGETSAFERKAINANILSVSGALLDNVQTVISGLPVSDHDHGINNIVYGDNGQLYMQAGSNTNGGIPGQLTSQQIQEENYYSASTIVGNLADPSFDGAITYDANGTPNGGSMSVYAPGQRNPFGLLLHSNGNLYATGS